MGAKYKYRIEMLEGAIVTIEADGFTFESDCVMFWIGGPKRSEQEILHVYNMKAIQSWHYEGPGGS